MKTFSDFSLIIFSYNEAGSLYNLVSKSIFFLKENCSKYEIVIVDDGSTDNTHEILSNIKTDFKDLKIIRHEKNKGIGQALKTGYGNVSHTYVCAIPGDGQFDINELRTVVPFSSNTYYSFFRKNHNYSLYRKLLTVSNRMFNYFFLNFDLKDVNWVKVYHKEQLSSISIKLNSSLIESEICGKLSKLGIKPIEIPSNYLTRFYGVSKGGGIKTVSNAVKDLIKLYLEVKR